MSDTYAAPTSRMLELIVALQDALIEVIDAHEELGLAIDEGRATPTMSRRFLELRRDFMDF